MYSPLEDDISHIKLIDTMPLHSAIPYFNSSEFISSLDLRACQAARMSTGNASGVDIEKDNRLIRYLIKNGHLTPFENIQLAFYIKAPIFVVRQWMRHRAFSYNEASARYQDKSEEAEFYIPQRWRMQDTINKQGSSGISMDSDIWTHYLKDFCEKGVINYNKLIRGGVSKEMARMFLPINMYTEFVVSGNLRNWLWNFCKQRNHSHAQLEIKVYAEYIEQVIADYAPITYQYYLGV